MSKKIFSMLALMSLTLPALAAPAPEIDGGLTFQALAFAAGVVAMIKKKR